ncbi:MAG TPA: class I SAM-dependent methyltransferase [Xanthobacteraceae bacterium]|nr:class I SAM-dependent methyltransferase [Xanthobacteraceae bacterium]
MVLSRGDYGFDAPHIPIGLAIAAALACCVAVILFASSWPWLAGLGLVSAVVFALSTFSFVWTTRRGKFIVWDELLDKLALRGDEHLLDVGCGRGMVLILAAKRLPAGRAVGVDLWSTADQSGNRQQATLCNAELEGVRDRIEVRTADMRQLPLPDESFDVVTSSLAIHNIRDTQGRKQALAEILRVLKAGGTAMIADILYTADYQQYFSFQPGTKVERQRLGWRFWYGGPHIATTLVKVRKSR